MYTIPLLFEAGSFGLYYFMHYAYSFVVPTAVVHDEIVIFNSLIIL